MSARLESNVLRVINPHFVSTKDTFAKQNLIKAVELIGKAVQPSHMQQDAFIFTRRGDLLKHMQVKILLKKILSVRLLNKKVKGFK